ncbi:MAG TPA: TonB-dependent receptor [Pyrinomonadaceae bacterium]|jgi:outer membrane receptor protein involved in Fe transport|nr:TonB-dependent receptor [Pyrinomonadaceae bacterium]
MKAAALTRVQRVPSQAVGFSAQWSRSLSQKQTLVAGFDGREVRGTSDELVFVQNRASAIVAAGGRERTLSFFVEDIFRVTDRLIVKGGVRLDRWRNYGALQTTQPVRQTGPATAATTINLFPDRRERALSPQLSVLYSLNDRVSLSASVYRAFRQPTLNELYRSFRVGDALTLANENLRAERLTGGEAGVSTIWLNQRLNVRGTFFWTETTRPISNVTLSTTPNLITRQRQNLGRTRSRGIEIEAEARVREHWTITGGYLFADASVLRFPTNTALEGLRLPQVARHQLNLQMRYTNRALFNEGLQTRLAGAQFDDDQNRFRLGRYFVMDALVSKPFARGLEIFGAVENLLNQKYEIGRTPTTTLGPPRLLRVGLRWRLGTQ